MKRLIIVSLFALALSACAKQEVKEPDPAESFPAPEAVTVDDGLCSANSITVVFDGSAATDAGAQSFSVALVPEKRE